MVFLASCSAEADGLWCTSAHTAAALGFQCDALQRSTCDAKRRHVRAHTRTLQHAHARNTALMHSAADLCGMNRSTIARRAIRRGSRACRAAEGRIRGRALSVACLHTLTPLPLNARAHERAAPICLHSHGSSHASKLARVCADQMRTRVRGAPARARVHCWGRSARDRALQPSVCNHATLSHAMHDSTPLRGGKPNFGCMLHQAWRTPADRRIAASHRWIAHCRVLRRSDAISGRAGRIVPTYRAG